MKEKLKQIMSATYILPAVFLIICILFSLKDYEPVIYEVKADSESGTEKITEDRKETEAQTEEAETVKEVQKGNFDLEDGIYEGTGTGFAGEIKVAVEIKDQSIISVKVLSTSDDDAFFNRAKGLIDRIIEKQSLDVDAVSGATYSSRGIIHAVRNALTGKKDTDTAVLPAASGSTGNRPSVFAVIDAAAYKDGMYYGSATGFAGAIKVQVTVSGRKIASIDVVQSSDGTSYMQKASSVLADMISGQTMNVDTVSGATYSSAGLINAVRNALSQAAVAGSTIKQDSNSGGGNETPEGNSGQTVPEGTVPYKDGIYYGSGEGYLGGITVAVVIQDHTIKAILLTDVEADDDTFVERAKQVLVNIVKTQSTEVDTVSGATFSSKGMLEAVSHALDEAKKATEGRKDTEDGTEGGNTGNETPDESKDDTENESKDNTENELKDDPEDESKADGTDTPEAIYLDGTYDAVVRCMPDEDEDFLPYELSLEITVKNGRILAVSDITGSGSDYDSGNDSYIKRAAQGTSKITGVVEQILVKQDLSDIDVVSRATCSSNAIIEACKRALENAVLQRSDE